jgi:uncharacterized protein DUF4410
MWECLSRRRLLTLATFIFVSEVAGCTFSIDTKTIEPAPTDASVVAVGKIEAEDADRDRIARRFRRTLAAALQETEAFGNVLAVAPPRLPANAILITGYFDKISEGSEVLRLGLGLGAGSPNLRARFEISDSSGRLLASFEEDARSLKGTGYAAHWNPADLDELTDDFAVDIAEAIARWRRGEELALSIWWSLAVPLSKHA